MLILKNKPFAQWAKKLKIADKTLVTVVNEIVNGLYETNLGGHIYKKRVAIGSRGKRSGVRTIIAFQINDKAIFIYGFSKGDKSNITIKEEESLKNLAKAYFSYDKNQLNEAINNGALIEVYTDEKVNS